MSLFSAARTRLQLLFARRTSESRINEELAFHIDMETQRLVREQGLAAGEARRLTVARFGGVTQHTESLRDGRGLAWLGGMSLDVKLGFRMLVKYPGLTLIGGLAMAFSIWVGALVFEGVRTMTHPTLPLPNGDRIVMIKDWDVAERKNEQRVLYDYESWRGMRSLSDAGVFQDVVRNLILGPDDSHMMQVAEITASGFRIASAKAFIGRMLVEADESMSAPPVIVLGYNVWKTRFAGDPGVIGRSVQIDNAFATVVGVMPEGFKFPVAHEAWMPMRIAAYERAPRTGPSVTVFGRLRDGATIAAAQTELTTIGKRMASELRSTHEHLQPQIGPYADMYMNPNESDRLLIRSFNIIAMLLVVLLSSNVALLLFARAATRESEIIVRSALGASRNRIVAQLFAEALVLGGVSAALGLAAVELTLRRFGLAYLEVNLGTQPFWVQPGLSLTTIAYAALLTVIAAIVSGVMPGLKITRGLGARLKEGTAGSGLRFGGVWTAVIILQVAVTVIVPAAITFEQRELTRIRSNNVNFADKEYLAVRLEMSTPSGGTDSSRYVTALATLRQRVAAEPGVEGVTFVDNLPRMPHPSSRVEVQGARAVADSTPLPWANVANIEPKYFETLKSPMLAGRAFNASDHASAGAAPVVIVDQGFVDQVLHGRNAIGQRVRVTSNRYWSAAAEASGGPWSEIVGVVKDMGMDNVASWDRPSGLYVPAGTESARLDRMIVHVRGDPLAIVPRIRAIATSVDPTLRLYEFQRVDQVINDMVWIISLWIRATAGLTALALLLSLAGIYAVLSFTVARRTREIGVRIALGASPRRVVTAIFRRPLTQVAMGVVLGGVVIGAIAVGFSAGALSIVNVALLVTYVALMFGVCMLACAVPTRRALSVEPTVALRSE
jgi:putative ABC transport system permease protein